VQGRFAETPAQTPTRPAKDPATSGIGRGVRDVRLGAAAILTHPAERHRHATVSRRLRAFRASGRGRTPGAEGVF
jgi:hypothetical protein